MWGLGKNFKSLDQCTIPIQVLSILYIRNIAFLKNIWWGYALAIWCQKMRLKVGIGMEIFT